MMKSVPEHEMRPRRLIETRTGRLADFSGRQTPRYAILSHRWSGNMGDEEVSFHEYLQLHPETRKKMGYRKITKACERALRDGLEFIWIDTCCIDQTDQDEVAQNVRSMYAYYRNSEICYAYLVDVWMDGSPWAGATIWRSEWFQRGWTLQELIAPQRVVFLNAHWRSIGDKQKLSSIIHYLTGIPASILDGSTSIHSVDFRTRMTWCAGRKTSKPPDLAYCLLGILGISMDPDYTESVQSAFRRLQNALVLSFPETFKIFEGAGSIYQILVRENARARVGVEQPYAIPEQNGPMPHVALGIHSNPGSLGPTPNTLPGTGSFSGAFIGRGMPDYSESSMKDLARLPGHSGPFNPSPHVMGNYYSEPLIAPDKKAFVTSMLTPQNNGDYLSPGIKFSQNSPQNPWLSQYPPSSWQLQHAGPVMYSQPPMASGPYRPNTSSSKRSYPLPDNPIPFVPTR